MPSKSLIHAAKLYDSKLKMHDAGIEGSKHLKPNIPKILKQVRKKRDYFVNAVADSVEKYKPYMLKGLARFEEPTKIRVGDKLYNSKATIVATGSSPYIPQKYKKFVDHIITSDTLFELKDLPERIAVIGLGVVGIEMAQALAKLGIKITAIHNQKTVGNVSDPKINEMVINKLKQDMDLWLDCDADVKISKNGLTLSSNGKKAEVDKLFICTGRTPNVEILGFKRIGVKTDEKGVPHYNRYNMKVQEFPIFLAGDVNNESAILHEAADEGSRAGYHAATGDGKQVPRNTMLHIAFTQPNTVIVGDTKNILADNSIIEGEANFDDQGRATIENENYGKIRLYADRELGTLRGAEIMAPAGEHLGHFLALAINQRLTAHEVLKTPFYHPTLEEGLKNALVDLANKIENKK
jgi:dihydrolipoamide dehydrogenase